jgi:hypothetical protein
MAEERPLVPGEMGYKQPLVPGEILGFVTFDQISRASAPIRPYWTGVWHRTPRCLRFWSWVRQHITGAEMLAPRRRLLMYYTENTVFNVWEYSDGVRRPVD